MILGEINSSLLPVRWEKSEKTFHAFVFVQAKLCPNDSSSQEHCNSIHLRRKGPVSLFTGRIDEIPPTPHWFLGWMLIRSWISQAALILVRITALITSTLFSTVIHYTEPSHLNHIQFAMITPSSTQRYLLQLKCCQEMPAGRDAQDDNTKSARLCVACTKSFIAVCDGMHFVTVSVCFAAH